MEYNTSKVRKACGRLHRTATFHKHTLSLQFLGECTKYNSNNKIINLSNLEFIDAEMLRRRCRDMLERHFLIQELTRYRLRLDHELSAARDNQRQIVPSDEDAKEIH